MTSPSNSKKKFSVLRYQRTWNRSIKGKMIASNMLMFTLTVFSISIFALMQTRLSLEQVTTEKLEQSLQLKSDSIKLWIGEIKSDMVWLTRMEGLTTKVKQLIESNRDSSEFEMLSKAITKEFQLLKATKQDWKEVLLLDRDGEVMISTNQSRLGDFRTLDKYFVEGKQRLYLQKIYPSPVTFGPTMTISAPLRNSFGDTIAVIAIHIDLLRMNEIIFEKDDPVDASESFLVDSFGALVSGKKAGQKAYIRGVRSVGIESAIAGQKGTQLYASFEGVEVIGSYAWIAEIDAGLIVEKPQSIAFAPLFNLTFNIIIFSLIILSILTALIYVFAGQISDPIRQVTQMTKQISKGIFSTRLSVESSDETGILADSVNKMSENLQRALIDLSKEKNKAVAATIAKSNFLANMSHEIRTPMNSVLGYAQLIARSSGVDSQVQEYVKRIELSGKHLLDLINTILDLSKIESGKSELNESSFDLTNLCNDLTSMFEFRCKEKGLEWIVETNFDQVFVYADKLKLQQILINLLNNAIKFTQQGHVKLKVSKLSRSKFYFEVIDTGRGISEEGKRKIFEPFHQQFENDQLIGSGLGLTIATNLIKDMGSSIHVDSELGKGSRFWFEFQLKPVSYEVSKSKQATTKQLKGVALVVDDIKDNREIIKCLLQDSGIEVLEAEDGKKAVELVKNRRELNQPLDYIFMDILMPTMSGEEAFNQIKNMNIKSNTKIYAVSASTLTHEKDHILSLGFDGFLAKPVTYEEIESIVHLQKNTISEETEVEGTRINTGENDSFVVPEKVIKEGIEACKIYHISKLTDCIEQIEQLGGRGVSLSEQLRAYLKDLNMEAIEKEFAQIKTVKGSFNE